MKKLLLAIRRFPIPRAACGGGIMFVGAVACAVFPAAGSEARIVTVPDVQGEEWQVSVSPAGTTAPAVAEAAAAVQITPAPSPPRPGIDADEETAAVEIAGRAADQYQAVYDAIPFNRAEYEANPSYRHEATMELLFGELRPMVVHKHAPAPAPPPAVIAPPWMAAAAMFDFSRGPYSGYPGLYGFRSGYRSRYHVYGGYLDLPATWW